MTGVQTCALPISAAVHSLGTGNWRLLAAIRNRPSLPTGQAVAALVLQTRTTRAALVPTVLWNRQFFWLLARAWRLGLLGDSTGSHEVAIPNASFDQRGVGVITWLKQCQATSTVFVAARSAACSARTWEDRLCRRFCSLLRCCFLPCTRNCRGRRACRAPSSETAIPLPWMTSDQPSIHYFAKTVPRVPWIRPGRVTLATGSRDACGASIQLPNPLVPTVGWCELCWQAVWERPPAEVRHRTHSACQLVIGISLLRSSGNLRCLLREYIGGDMSTRGGASHGLPVPSSCVFIDGGVGDGRTCGGSACCCSSEF